MKPRWPSCIPNTLQPRESHKEPFFCVCSQCRIPAYSATFATETALCLRASFLLFGCRNCTWHSKCVCARVQAVFSSFYSFPNTFWLLPTKELTGISWSRYNNPDMLFLRRDPGFTGCCSMAGIRIGFPQETASLCQISPATLLPSGSGPSAGKFSLLKWLCEHIFIRSHSSRGLVALSINLVLDWGVLTD